MIAVFKLKGNSHINQTLVTVYEKVTNIQGLSV